MPGAGHAPQTAAVAPDSAAAARTQPAKRAAASAVPEPAGNGPRTGPASGQRRPAAALDGASALDGRLRAVERGGRRVTPQRRAVLAAMLSAGRVNVSAEEICRGARALCPSVNLATTYRTLDLFGRLGLVRRLAYGDGRSVFCANPRPHYHGTCLRCGAVVDLARGRVADALAREQSGLTDGAFTVVDHRVEFYGYCAACRPSAAAGR